MAAEDRKQTRNMLRADHEVLRCHVRLAGEHIPISTIFDFSEVGVGVATTSPLPLGAVVDLNYRNQSGDDITLSGKVAWCAPSCLFKEQLPELMHSVGYRGGIDFEQTEQGTRDALICALRPHLDPETLCV